MSYQVIARRWRPQNFSEIISQDHVSRTIQNSIKSGRVSHSYIFSGPRGVGKTTTARVLAKSLNCVNGPTPEPCGVCENCVEIKEGNSFDVIEIDGASNNGVEHIRNLRETINFAPVKSKYKIYIIDEVHMLSTSAFNALLKTLEEPPAHAVFVFATTEIHKVPDTILSRCQKFYFRKIDTAVVVSHLKTILDGEGVGYDEAALYPIARASGGSMRDAQSLLEQVISFSSGDISVENTMSVLGILPLASYCSMLEFVAEGNLSGIVKETEKIASMGADIPRYSGGFQEIVRAVRMIKHKVVGKDVLGFSEEEYASVEKIAERYTDDELSGIFKIAQNLSKDLRFLENDRTLLEMALFDMVSFKKAPSLASIIRKIEEIGSSEKKNTPLKGNDRKEVKSSVDDLSKTLTGIDSQADALPKRNDVKADIRPRDFDKEAPAVEKNETIEKELPSVRMEVKESWARVVAGLKVTKLYLHRKIESSKVDFFNREIRVESVADNGMNNSLDAKDIDFLNVEVSKLAGPVTVVQIKPVNGKENHKEDTPPIEEAPPPDAMMVDGTDLSDIVSEDPFVSKIVEMFYGEIIEKGE